MFDSQTDFEQVVDGLETVVLLTSNSESRTITGALRRRIQTAEPAPSGGQTAQHDCVWHLPVSQLTERPRLGAKLRDAAGDEWTILAVEAETLSARWQSSTRNLTLAFDLTERIQVQRPAYQFDKHGSAKASWQTLADQIPARVQPNVRQQQQIDGAGQDVALFVIFVADWSAYSVQVRIQDTSGRVFEVIRIQREARLGELVQLLVRQIA